MQGSGYKVRMGDGFRTLELWVLRDGGEGRQVS